jgi:hypothetical protein
MWVTEHVEMDDAIVAALREAEQRWRATAVGKRYVATTVSGDVCDDSNVFSTLRSGS